LDSYERFVRALNFEEPDRVPTWDIVENIELIRQLGGTGPAEEIVPRTYKKLGVDATRWPGFLPATEDKIVVKNRCGMQDPNGQGYLICEKPLTYKISARENTEWLIDSPFKTINDLYEIKLEPMPEDEIAEDYFQTMSKWKKIYEKEGIVFCGCLACIFDDCFRLLGWPLFIKAVYTARDAIQKLMDKFTHVSIIMAKVLAEMDMPAVMYGDDIAYKKGLMMPPKFFREELWPRVKKVITPLKKKGIKLLFHSDGNYTSIIPDLIELGFDGIHSLEPNAGVDIGKVKEQYGDKLVLLGNIDVTYILSHASTYEVELAVKECIRKAAPGSGFCLGSCTEILPSAKPENVIAMFKTNQKYGKYPISSWAE
jgi:uroporphyrinogen decarboxylase